MRSFNSLLILASIFQKLHLSLSVKRSPSTSARSHKPNDLRLDSIKNYSVPLVFNLSVATWNLAESSPNERDFDFIKEFRSDDVVIIGVQECEDIRPRRSEGRRSRALRLLLVDSLGTGFECVARHKMGGIQLAVFAKKTISKKIRGIQILDVACGVGNVLTNKGAVCVLLRIRGRTLAFVNAHLAAHQGKVKERNADYHRIASSLSERAPVAWTVSGGKPSSLLSKATRSSRSSQLNRSGTSDSRAALRKSSLAGDVASALGFGDENPQWLKQVLSMAKSRVKKAGMEQSSAHSTGGNRNARPIRVSSKRTVPGNKKTRSKKSLNTQGQPKRKIEKTLGRSLLVENEEEVENEATKDTPDVQEAIDRHWPFHGTVFLGDLNYRVDLPRLEMEMFKYRYCVPESPSPESRLVPPPASLPQLWGILEYDQLTREKCCGRIFRGFKEGKICFLPTFKYDKRSDRWDSSKKRRSPAWTDRILYLTKEEEPDGLKDVNTQDREDDSDAGELKPKSPISTSKASADSIADNNSPQRKAPLFSLRSYSSIDVRHSDHRPVVAKFSVVL